MNYENNTILSIKEDVICEVVEGDMVVFSPQENCIINLNTSASRIYELLKEEISFEKLVDRYYGQLQDEEKPKKDIVSNDICNMLSILENRGILKRC